jgi:hypothetical protein
VLKSARIFSLPGASLAEAYSCCGRKVIYCFYIGSIHPVERRENKIMHPERGPLPGKRRRAPKMEDEIG